MRGSRTVIDTVGLIPGGNSLHQTEVPDQVHLVDALDDEPRAVIEAIRQAPVARLFPLPLSFEVSL